MPEIDKEKIDSWVKNLSEDAATSYWNLIKQIRLEADLRGESKITFDLIAGKEGIKQGGRKTAALDQLDKLGVVKTKFSYLPSLNFKKRILLISGYFIALISFTLYVGFLAGNNLKQLQAVSIFSLSLTFRK